MVSIKEIVTRLSNLEAKTSTTSGAQTAFLDRGRAETVNAPWRFPGGLFTTKLQTAEASSKVAKIDNDGVIRASSSLISYSAGGPASASGALSATGDRLTYNRYSPNSKLYEGVVYAGALEGVRILEAGTYFVNTATTMQITAGAPNATSEVICYVRRGSLLPAINAPGSAGLASHPNATSLEVINTSFIYDFQLNDIFYVYAYKLTGAVDLKTVAEFCSFNIIRLY